MIKHNLLILLSVGVAAWSFAAKVGVQLFDMYKVEAVYLMTSEEVKTLKAELAEEKRVFNKAFSNVKTKWTKEQQAAYKAGNKDYPKFPTKAFMWVRSAKFKTFSNDATANEWYSKQKRRVDAEMAAKAAADLAAIKSAKSSVTSGYKSRDDRKARKHADKSEMTAAAKEKAGEYVETEMATLLEFNRPVLRHFVFDPVAGADKNVQKKIEQQEAALKLYRERKAAGPIVKDDEED